MFSDTSRFILVIPGTVRYLVYLHHPRRTFPPWLKLRRVSSVNFPCFNYENVQNISWLKRLCPWRYETPWKLLKIIFAKPQWSRGKAAALKVDEKWKASYRIASVEALSRVKIMFEVVGRENFQHDYSTLIFECWDLFNFQFSNWWDSVFILITPRENPRVHRHSHTMWKLLKNISRKHSRAGNLQPKSLINTIYKIKSNVSGNYAAQRFSAASSLIVALTKLIRRRRWHEDSCLLTQNFSFFIFFDISLLFTVLRSSLCGEMNFFMAFLSTPQTLPWKIRLCRHQLPDDLNCREKLFRDAKRNEEKLFNNNVVKCFRVCKYYEWRTIHFRRFKATSLS